MTVLRVARVIPETPEAVSLEFEMPVEEFSYRPGQFLTVRVPSEQTGSVARCYSLCSAPHEDTLKVTVKRTADGYASNWLGDNAVSGMELEVLPPAGVFTPKSSDADLLLCAAGSGITPVLSILKSMLVTGTGQVTLLYANRNEQSVIFAADLVELAREYPDRLVVVHWLESVQGMPTVDQLTALAAPWATREAFICGPAAFMAATAAALSALGADRRQIHIEKFTSLRSNPFDQADHPAPSTLNTPVIMSTTSLTVTLDGAAHSFTWPRSQKLLDFLLDNGIDAPYSCREGACSACACRVTSGEVKLLHNEILESEDLDDGIILACQAIALTDDVSVDYD